MLGIYRTNQKTLDARVRDSHLLDYCWVTKDAFAEAIMNSLENLFEMLAVSKKFNLNVFDDCIGNIGTRTTSPSFCTTAQTRCCSAGGCFSLATRTGPCSSPRASRPTSTARFSLSGSSGQPPVHDFPDELLHAGRRGLPDHGALEYVKFKPQIHSGQTRIGCVSLVQVFGDDFNLILSHVSGDPAIMEEEAVRHQSV